MLTVGGICVLPTVVYSQYRVSGSTLTAVGLFQLPALWSGTLSRMSYGIPRSAQAVSDVFSKRICSLDTSASTALGIL